MAILKAQKFNLEFSYYNLNGCNEIEYSFDIKLNGKQSAIEQKKIRAGYFNVSSPELMVFD